MIIKYGRNLLGARLPMNYNIAMSKDEFTRLYKYMSSEFKLVNDRLEQTATKTELDTYAKAVDGQFVKLFKYMQREFKTVNERLEQAATKTELNTYVNAVDAFAKQAETYMQEMLALGHQVDRHERWHKQTAKACGVKLQA